MEAWRLHLEPDVAVGAGDFDGGDFGDDNFDRLYGNGKSYLFLRHQLSGGHSSLVRQKLSVDNYPADTPSVG
ncbi:hypothetical protein AB0I34_07730 [Kribbella sp. NPDC050281]|uniref:hypothetical protein n=1 Tax=Kribbella sp. NPDC050281 TaxID=3155515 RepID=UPI0033F59D88